jgi:hypothetical protein
VRTTGVSRRVLNNLVESRQFWVKGSVSRAHESEVKGGVKQKHESV